MAESTETRITGFGTTEVERRAETAATAAAATARAMIESQYIMAMRNPRDWDDVRLKVLKECDRPSFAREAIYHKPIGQGVTGLSIRFAEVAVRCMGNMAIPTTTTFDNEVKRIVCQSVVDLESNVHYSRDVTVNKTVERQTLRDGQTAIDKRTNSRGQMIFIIAASEDDLLNKEGALVSKALRTLVLRLLPGDIQAEARARVTATMSKEIASDPEGQKKAILDAFYVLGIKPAQIKELLGHDMDAVSVEEVATLRSLHNAIRDGEANIKEAIDNAKEQRGEKTPSATTDETTSRQPITQTVSTKAAEVLAQARASTPPAAEQEGVGRGRPPKCPVCKEANLKSAVEREAKMCDACRQKQGETIETPAPAQSTEPEPDPVVQLVQKLRFRFMVNAEGNLAAAELELSGLTAGKVQKFEKLAEYLRANPALIGDVTEALK